jgi:hypothetical protein
MRIFGREPAVIIGLLGSIITAFAALHMPWFSAGESAALFGALSALLIAACTRPLAPALFTAAFVAVAALFAQYGAHLSNDLIAGVTGLILAAFAMAGIRPQVVPVAPAPAAPVVVTNATPV